MGGPTGWNVIGLDVLRIFSIAALVGQACMSMVTEYIDCQGSAKLANIQRCFMDQNITWQHKQDNNPRETIVDDFISKQPKDLCLKKSQYKRAMTCVMTQSFNCMLPQFHGYMPQPSKMDALVDKLCENGNQKGVQCIQARKSHITDCHQRKFVENYNKSSGGQMTAENKTAFTVMCSNYYLYIVCLSKEGPSCGCPTVEWYQQILFEILYPPDCRRPVSGRGDLVCTENTGGGRGPSWRVYASLVMFWACVSVMVYIR